MTSLKTRVPLPPGLGPWYKLLNNGGVLVAAVDKAQCRLWFTETGHKDGFYITYEKVWFSHVQGKDDFFRTKFSGKGLGKFGSLIIVKPLRRTKNMYYLLDGLFVTRFWRGQGD